MVTEAEKAKREGIEKIAKARKEWFDQAIVLLDEFCLGRVSKFTIEHFKIFYAKKGGLPPPHPNCWGALLPMAARRKPSLVGRNGTYVKASMKSSHARPISEWFSKRAFDLK
ncbi:MAG: hypothetical protein E6R03_11625 [Hyphomicrobiaceae bacterium]|nr:MAG: hypothetical protein E6R03_11625 [Hyphomicrobiaceae bacterium]